jgi:hypothetical protein
MRALHKFVRKKSFFNNSNNANIMHFLKESSFIAFARNVAALCLFKRIYPYQQHHDLLHKYYAVNNI